MNNKLIQVDFYPDGRIDYWYEGETNKKESKASFKPLTPKEALHKRLEEYKKNKEEK